MPIPEGYKAKAAPGEFAPIPEGLYTLEIYDLSLVDQVTYMTRNLPEDKQQKEEMVKIEFAILDDRDITPEGSDEKRTTRGRRIWKTIRPLVSYAKNGKTASNMYSLMRACWGTDHIPVGPLTAEDLNSLIEEQIGALIKQEKGSDGRIYANFDLSSTIRVIKKLPSWKNDPANKKKEEINTDDFDTEVTEEDINKIFPEA